MSTNDVVARNDYIANGSTTVFAYGFRIVDQSHIEVLKDGVVQTITTHYTVSGVGDSGGGNITFLVAPANALAVALLRKQPFSQLSVYQANEDFPAVRIEKDLDKLAMVVQQLREGSVRALSFVKKSILTGPILPEGVVGKVLRWKTTTELENVSPAEAGAPSIPFAISIGGTEATTAAGARTNLGLGALAVKSTVAAGDIDTDAVTTAKINALAVTDAKVATANKDGAAGTASMRTLGTGATQAAAGNDSRLSDTRTPSAHKDTHKSGGSDPFASTDLLEAVIKRVRETGGADLTVGAIVDGEILRRTGTTINSSAAAAPGAHQATHMSGGADPFTSTEISEALSKRLRESGGADLLIGAITDGQILVRSGTNIISAATATPSAHKDTHKSGGSDAFVTTDILEGLVKRIKESGGSDLAIGSLVDGEFLKRSGTSIISAAVAAVGAYGIRNLVGQNDATTPNTKFAFSADFVVLRNSSDAVVVRSNTGTLTNDTGVAGSTANGRDQAGAFGASNWIHFYFIWNGTTLATLSSTVAPPTGPTLPSGYTHWAYAGAVRYNATPLLVKTRWRGSWASYEGPQIALTGGTSLTEAAIATTTFVPPNALMVNTQGILTPDTTDVTSITLRYVTTADYYLSGTSSGGATAKKNTAVMIPNLSQNIYYLINTTGSAADYAFTLKVLGYTMPNGGE